MDPSRARARLLTAFGQDNWQLVRHRARQVLAAHPRDAEVHFMLGVACLSLGQFEPAVAALHEAVTLQASNSSYMAHYARALESARRLPEARAVADRAMALGSSDALILDMLGAVYLQVHAIEASADVRKRAVALAPDSAALRFNLGYVLSALDDRGGAVRELDACVKLDPRRWAAHLMLSKLRPQSVNSHHLQRLRGLLARHADDAVAQMFLHMALAKENEDLGDYPTAFAHYARGKAAGRSLRPASAERDRVMFNALERAFPEVETPASEGGVVDAPIFIVGMPRTGTTLLDRMLSRHPDVLAAGELRNFATALQLASGSPVALLSLPDIAEQIRSVDWSRLGAAYIESTRPATAAHPRFTDDMPHNFLYAGFIARALPYAKIVCLRRNPLDTCVSNFRNLFQLESGFYDYSLDLLDTGRYFIEFDRLMAHWRDVLPGRILEVEYESLVTDPEPVMRGVLAFCDLGWSDVVLHPEENTTPVNTPNAWQVRAPVYTSAIGRWRRYEAQLEPLRKLLADAGITLPD